MEALSRAKQHKLNVAVIAKEVVRLILEEAFAVSPTSVRVSSLAYNAQTIPSLSSDQPDVANFVTGLSERDVYLIRSIEWLTMMPETMDEALVKSNDVARYFLGGRVLSSVRTSLTCWTQRLGKRVQPSPS